MTPQLVEGIKALLASGSPTGVMGPSQIDRVLGEFERLKNDPSLTPEQRAQLQGLQSFIEAAMKKCGITLERFRNASRTIFSRRENHEHRTPGHDD